MAETGASIASWVVSLLEKSHLREDFDCGEPPLNEFLQHFARQNQREDVGRTWVATLPGELRVLGFYTLSVASVSRETLPREEAKRLPRYPVPVAHLGRLAVAISMRGKGLGEHLLLHALEQVARVSEVVGIFAVEVRAKSNSAQRFYQRYGFSLAADDGHHLYLSLKAVRRLF